MPKLVVDLQRGLIEVEASDQFVSRVYSDVRETILKKLASDTHHQNAKERAATETPPKEDGAKTRKRARSGGPSCASRIEAAKEEGYFKEPRSAGEIREKLKEQGSTYASKNIAAALTNLTKARKLRRFNENGWKYQNP